MFTYEIIDDFVPKYHQDCIEKEIYTSSWKYNPNISGVPKIPIIDNNLKLANGQSGFELSISDESSPVLFGMCLPLIARAIEMIPENVRVNRMRAGMFLPADGGLHTPHVDYYEKHYTLLYYVNEADGDTYLFNEMASPISKNIYPQQSPNYPELFTLNNNVSPKRGRAVLFNGLIYHSSSLPTSNERIAININLAVLDNTTYL